MKGMGKGVVFKDVRTEEVATDGTTGLENSRWRGKCCGQRMMGRRWKGVLKEGEERKT